MKKNVILIILVLSMIMLFAGCKKNGTGNTTEENTDTTEGTDNTDSEDSFKPVENTLSKGDYKLEDHITLGKYKGVEVSVEKLEVTEEALNAAIQADLAANGAEANEITDRAVQNGDIVNIDFEGFKDGVAFEGGSSEGVDLTIGSGQFIPGFEEGLIGAKTGDKLDLNLTFPENYQAEDLAGQAVVFKVTVNSIKHYELTEEYVTGNTDFATMDEYKNYISEQLTLEYEDIMKQTKEQNVLAAILDASTITVPQSLMDYYINDIKVIYTNYATMYGMDFSAFIQANGLDEAAFNEMANEYAQAIANRELVLKAIMEAENITLSDEEYDQKVAEYAADYNYETVEDFLADANEEALREEILFQKVIDFITAEAVEI